ncbi:unnamed protein product [Nippostrongylus brasiliensis]|uniref:SARAH domain-containing protein n=1 Tax=Nippostrongylus brasiliensis TaxID=27835 RepID=A0A0N4XWA8_NIPBR|nr:unnamed protein product [Nippostrongylus brasiliensis]
MPWLTVKTTAANINKCALSINPFMNTAKAESTIVDKHTRAVEEIPAKSETDLSISSFLGMRWPHNIEIRKLDQMLIKNIRSLMEEERDRQRDYERLCQTRISY